MLTQCPHCNTVFRLRPEQLSAAGGKVRCGQCHSIFNASQHLVEEQSSQPGLRTPSSAPNRLEDWAPSPQRGTTAGRTLPQSPRPEPATPRNTAAEPAASKSAVAEPAVPEPATTRPAVAEPAVAEPAVAEPAVAEPAVAEPAVAEPAVAEPAVAEPAVAEPAVAEPAVAEPAIHEPAISELDAATENGHGRSPADDVDDLSIQLDQLFSDIDQTAERSAATPAQPQPAAGNESFGEVQIESLLTSDAGPEALELPWHQEEPATAASDAAAPEAAADPARLQTQADEDVAEFDLPDPELTTAQPIFNAASTPPAFSEITASPRSSGWATLGWTLAILLALATLVGQYAYINSTDLVRYTQLRPALEQLCRYTGCAIPARRDVKAITLLERDVRSSNKYQGVLVISATLVNRAPFAQPYPDVEVAMHDVDGNVVASRLFHPREYLAPGEHHAAFAPGATAHLELRVADPGPAAVGFEFTFY